LLRLALVIIALAVYVSGPLVPRAQLVDYGMKQSDILSDGLERAQNSFYQQKTIMNDIPPDRGLITLVGTTIDAVLVHWLYIIAPRTLETAIRFGVAILVAFGLWVTSMVILKRVDDYTIRPQTLEKQPGGPSYPMIVGLITLGLFGAPIYMPAALCAGGLLATLALSAIAMKTRYSH